jgi:hypothetical protein
LNHDQTDCDTPIEQFSKRPLRRSKPVFFVAPESYMLAQPFLVGAMTNTEIIELAKTLEKSGSEWNFSLENSSPAPIRDRAAPAAPFVAGGKKRGWSRAVPDTPFASGEQQGRSSFGRRLSRGRLAGRLEASVSL